MAMIYDGKLIWVGRTSEIDRAAIPMSSSSSMAAPTGPIKMQVRGSDGVGKSSQLWL